jgi:hypothetical protein
MMKREVSLLFSDFIAHSSPQYGTCYTFNAPPAGRTPHRTYRAGATYGLQLMLYADLDQYMFAADSPGVR